jgi:membrane protein YdbS with pleckstrin-like domain
MLKEMYLNKTDKELKNMLNLYSALLISTIIIPIILTTISYFLSGKIQFSYIIPFVIVMVWSVINVVYLKNKLNNKNNNEM